MEVAPGARLFVKTTFGEEVEFVATSGIEEGDKFPVVWVCSLEEWDRAAKEGREAEADPWPVRYVRLASEEEVTTG